MKLAQGQIWRLGERYFRIVTWQRLSIEYKESTKWDSNEGGLQKVTKKEFCRLIKRADLVEPGNDSKEG